ncbi:MAG: hypothetical protein IPP74_11095 [Alphaproteobacteria bacterium]|nr:hypothetical protein [Alphaproteobacteria bacterium]
MMMSPYTITALESENQLLQQLWSRWFSDIHSQKAFHALLEFFPVQVFDENQLVPTFHDVRRAFDRELIQYAVKANPRAVPLLAKAGCQFEVASEGEIELLRRHGVVMASVLYTNPSRSSLENKLAIKAGIRRFVCHGREGLESLREGLDQAISYAREHQLAEGHPAYVDPHTELDILIRLEVDKHGVVSTGAGISNVRFGTNPEHAVELMIQCAQPVSAGGFGFKPYGVSFHVGSDEQNPEVWRIPIEHAFYVFDESYKRAGILLKEVDIGGGLPFQRRGVKKHRAFALAIRGYFQEYFGKDYDNNILVSLEPGRALASSAGVTFTKIIDIKKRQIHKQDGTKGDVLVVTENGGWVNAGLVAFGYKTYAFTFEDQQGFCDCPGSEMALAKTYGETCTDFDNSGEHTLHASIKRGDNLVFLGTGVYANEFKSHLCSLQPPLVIWVKEGEAFPSFRDFTAQVKQRMHTLERSHVMLREEINELYSLFDMATKN